MQATDKRKCLQKAHLIKDCYPKYKTQQENNQPTKKCAKDLTESSLGRQAAGKQACRDAPHHISREMQIKTKRCFNLAQAQSTDNASAARTRSSRNPHSLRVGMQRGTPLCNTVGQFLMKLMPYSFSYHMVRQSCCLLQPQRSRTPVNTKTCTQTFTAALFTIA